MDARAFRNALGAFATGVTIITTRDEAGADVGMTANSFNSVSLDPPMILWSIGKNSTNLDAFMAAPHFAVHILAAEQESLSGRFAKSGTDKFADVPVTRGAGEVPLIEGAAARFQCRTAFRHEAGDHYIVVGEVVAFDHDGHAPLAFHSGRYGVFIRNEPAVAAEGGEPLLGDLLARAGAGLADQLDAALAGDDLTANEFELLRILIDGAPRAAVVVGDDIDVADLVARGLLVESGEDVALSESGRAVLEKALGQAKAVEAAAAASLSAHELVLLRRFLGRLTDLPATI